MNIFLIVPFAILIFFIPIEGETNSVDNWHLLACVKGGAMRFYFLFLTLFSVFMISVPLTAHEAHPHEEAGEKIAASQEQGILAEINRNYVREIKPIFQNSCFNCHSTNTQYPWYYKIPGAKQLIDHDIREAKKHIDMTNDFPFKGHGTLSEDLEAIGKSVNKGTMPPLRYILMHWNARLAEEEKKAILQWVEESQNKLLEERSF